MPGSFNILTSGHEFSSVLMAALEVIKTVCGYTMTEVLNLFILPIYLNSGHFTLISRFPVPHSPPRTTQGIKSHVKGIVSAVLRDTLETGF